MSKIPQEAISLCDLREANAARQKEWCPDQLPDLLFRGNELGGECGEAQNVIKKLERERLGWAGSRATVDDLADELADVVICADLTALAAGIDLNAAVARKFNATSEKVGLNTRLAADAARAQEAEVEPVAWMRIGGLELPADCRLVTAWKLVADQWSQDYGPCDPLYATPPAPQPTEREKVLEAALIKLLNACEADFGVPGPYDEDDEAVGSGGNEDGSINYMAVTFGDLRRARAALTGKAPSQTDRAEGGE